MFRNQDLLYTFQERQKIVPINLYFILFSIIFNLIIFSIEKESILEIGWRWGSLHNVFITFKYEWFRFLTAPFINSDLISLLITIFWFFLFGRVVEFIYGYQQYLIIFVLSSVISNLMVYFFVFPYLDGIEDIQFFGASGGIFGFIGAFITFLFVYNQSYNNLLFFSKAFVIYLLFLFFFCLIFGESFLLVTISNLSGLFSGVLICLFFNILSRKFSYPLAGKVKNIIFIFLCCFLLISFLFNFYLFLTEYRLKASWIDIF